MILGIVGHEEKKFTRDTYLDAIATIESLVEVHHPERIVSGGCHLGGVDSYAITVAQAYGIPYTEFLPKTLSWEGGYKDRNREIARASDLVVSIVVKEYPPDYVGMRFNLCYHCNTNTHIKSGGCWTVKEARKMGKEGLIIEL